MARANTGWFKAHRDAWDKDLSQNVYLWAIWNALLHMAVWKETQIIWEGKQRILKPGSVIMGISQLAEKWECSRTTIWKWLKYLHDSGRIAYETCTRGTLVTICNWESYQISEDTPLTPSLHEVSAKCMPSVYQVALSKEDNKEKKKEHKKENNIVGILTAYPPEFDELWIKYGKRGDKKAALAEYRKLKLTDDQKTQLTKSVDNYVKNNPELQFRKHFCRFLKSDWRELETISSSAEQMDWDKFWEKVENDKRAISNPN